MKAEDKKALEAYRKRLAFAKSSGGVDPYETKDEMKERINRAKKDVKFLVEYYFPHYATSECADFHIKAAKYVQTDPAARVFFEWGRGLAKSVWADIIIPFWLWMRDETNYMVIVTTNKDRASELLEDIRAEFEGNPRIINDFGEQHNVGQWEKGFFITKGGFIGKALGAGQSVRGLRVKAQRPDYIVVDDLETKETAQNPKRQKKLAKWIERDLIPTMDGYPKRFVYANNKFEPEMIQKVLQTNHPNWRIHHVKAYDAVTLLPTWHQKYDDDYYAAIIEDLGTLAAEAEYNNEPHLEGEIFTDELIQWDKLPRLDHMKAICGFWDIAYAGTKTSDFNAVRVWGLKERTFYYINGFVKQSKITPAIQWICDYQSSIPDSVIIHWRYEAQFWNDEIERTVEEVCESNGFLPFLTQSPNPSGKKYDRILTLHPYYQNGRIYYNEKLKAHNDTQKGLAQLKGIEPGYTTKDDAPDADQQAISWLSKWISKKSTSKPLTASITRKTHF